MNLRFLILVIVVSAIGLMPPGCAKRELSIQVKGSDTEVNLVQRLAEEFMKKSPGVSISVTGGGSGVGIASLIDGTTDIANSSRPMKDDEIKLAKQKGVEPIGIVFAIDGLSIICNEENPLDSLTIDELAKIYRGEITNWKEVGGLDMEISLYGRTSASGTYAYFRDQVLKGDYSPKMRTLIGTSHIIEAVKKDKTGIGYVGVGYVVDERGEPIKGINVLKIRKDRGSQAISPLDMEAVKSGLYPITRPLYQYVNGKPKGKILEFIRFELSREGQEIVVKEGYYPVTPEYMESNRKIGVVE